MERDQIAISGALTSCPDIWEILKTEPQPPWDSTTITTLALPMSPGMAINALSFSDFFGAAAGAAASFPGFKGISGPAIAVPSPRPSDIGRLIGIGPSDSFLQNAVELISQKAQELMGINSAEFYSAIGVSLPPAQPIHQVLAQAEAVNKDCPSLWYVNFPKHMSNQDADMVQRYRQSMMDFRSWSSSKWWQEVNRRYGTQNDPVRQVELSKEFAKIACEDMVKMSWLRTTSPPYEARHFIDCSAAELHSNIVARALSGLSELDHDTLEAVEPLLQDIVRSFRPGRKEFKEMKVVLIEKYIYDNSTNSIKSYIRLVSFEVQEAFYDVIMGKAQSQARVNLQLSLLQYEAIFESSLWEQFSSSIPNDQLDMFRDFIGSQTIDIKPGPFLFS